MGFVFFFLKKSLGYNSMLQHLPTGSVPNTTKERQKESRQGRKEQGKEGGKERERDRREGKEKG